MHYTAEASAGIAPPCFMQHFVTFPNDPQRYYFLTKDVEKWLVKEPSTGAGTSRAAVASAAPNGSGGSPTKRSGKAPAAPASPSKVTPKTSPSKKAKVAGKTRWWQQAK